MTDWRAMLDQAMRLHRGGQFAAAEAAYEQILYHNPHHADALHLLGMLRYQQGDPVAAESLMRRAVQWNPNVPHYHANLGGILGLSGRADEAIAVLQSAIRLSPRSPEAHNNLGVAFEQAARFEEAIAAYRRAIELRPGYAEAFNHLGNSLRWLGRLDEAYQCHQHALAQRPDLPEAVSSLAATCMELGRVEETIASYRRLTLLRPQSAATHSDLLYTLHYDPNISPDELFQNHLAWAQRHEAPLTTTRMSHAFPRAPGTRLRIGYVSADFRQHPVATFLLPLLANHDRRSFENFCYSDVMSPDSVTETIRGHCDCWRDAKAVSDAELPKQINADAIDVLIDLAGHCGRNRLLTFAHKPAPIQVTWNGYIDTTGMTSMDYRITDAWHDPPGTCDNLHTEKLIRLPRCNWCYRPPTISPDVAAAQASRDRPLVFGCFNKLIKVSDRTLAVWSKLLRQVKNSRLMLCLAGGDLFNPSVRRRLTALGIDPSRLVLLPKVPAHFDYLSRFNQIDIALDTFPFNGITTTCDALWMGTPVVSLAGPTHVSRAGVSILSSIGLPEMIAQSEEEYVEIAAGLDRDRPRLAILRAMLRRRMIESPLRDEMAFATAMEDAYRQMWRSCAASGTHELSTSPVQVN